MKLTREQQAMLQHCIDLKAAWTTSVGCENHALLEDWERRGWAQSVKPPEGMHSLASYLITDAGREALEASI